jgi:hypothetical protein
LHVHQTLSHLIRAASAAVVIGLGAVPAAAQTPRTVPEIWTAWCARCHAADGSGKVATPTVRVTPMDFSDCRIAAREPDADWEAAIRYGGPAVGLSSEMPAFGEALDDDQVIGLVAHIRRFCLERDWPSGNLNFPRPILTGKAFPEDEIVLAPVAAHRPHHPDFATLTAIYERRVGTRTQVELTLPVESVYVAERQNGLGDVEVGVKYAINPRSSAYLVSAGFDFLWPTGGESRLVGDFHPLFEPYVAVATMAGANYVQAQLKVELPRPGSWRKKSLMYSVYLGRDTSIFPDTWTIGLELTSEGNVAALTPQIRKGLTRTGALAAAFGVRLALTDRIDQGVRYVGYLLWEYREPVFAAR